MQKKEQPTVILFMKNEVELSTATQTTQQKTSKNFRK